jgi:Mn-dependent DtxR family transcriptional regulator
MSGDSRPKFTDRQGQYLAFIDAYTLVNGRAPGRTDIQHFFRITPPSVHQMLLTLERDGLIGRQKGVARSIRVLVNPADLPRLQPIRTPVQGY